MNRFKAFLAIVAILCTVGVVTAKSTRSNSRSNTKSKPNYGTEGTISKLGSRGFLLTIKADQVLEVVCDNNTKFLRAGEAVDPSEVKEGMKVGVIGSVLSATRLQAATVNLLDSGSAPKAKPKK